MPLLFPFYRWKGTERLSYQDYRAPKWWSRDLNSGSVMAEHILVSLLHLCVCLHIYTHTHIKSNLGKLEKCIWKSLPLPTFFPTLGCCLEFETDRHDFEALVLSCNWSQWSPTSRVVVRIKWDKFSESARHLLACGKRALCVLSPPLLGGPGPPSLHRSKRQENMLYQSMTLRGQCVIPLGDLCCEIKDFILWPCGVGCGWAQNRGVAIPSCPWNHVCVCMHVHVRAQVCKTSL